MDITSALNNKQLRFSVLEGIACLWSWCSAFISQMRCLHSSCAILSTMAMLCWCRTPAAGSWREATSTRSCCSTPWVAGPRMMTCPWTGGWNNMQLCSKKRFLIPSQPLLPSSRLPCYMLAPQRWAVPWAGLWDSQVQGQVSEKQEHFWDSSLWADSDIFWSLFFIWSDCFHIEFVGLPWWLRVCLQCKRPMFLGREDPLEKGMATHSSILAWRIPWTEESGGLQSMWLQRVGHDWATNTFHLSKY